ncbi:MAG: hypothetical protein K2W85_07660 [Phycisphaerales bacterium]|nr:hypothetical protein [Phycisphaerales bacterium]
MLKRRLILLPFVIVIMSIVFTIGEVRYMLWGQTVDATVLSIELKEKRRRYGRKDTVKMVKYSFLNSDQKQIVESDAVDQRWPVSPPTAKIEYVDGMFPTSRLIGNDHKNWLWVSVPMAVVASWMLGWTLAGKRRPSTPTES